MNKENRQKLISEALAIEAESAYEAGTLGYMARAMVQATMPHRRTDSLHHERKNGHYRLTMVAGNPDIGLPFGSIPRLMLAWIGTEALKTKSQEIILGDSMSGFLRELGLVPTGGRWGTIPRIKDQSKRLFSCAITCIYTNDDERFANDDPFNIGKANLWWNKPKVHPEQLSIFKSTLRLSDRFYSEIIEHPVPVDMRILKALKRSPMELDIYCWTIYRIYTLNHSRRSTVTIPWEALRGQFGSNYADTPQGARDFKREFIKHLNRVHTLFYKQAKIEATPSGLILKKSPLQIPKKPPKTYSV